MPTLIPVNREPVNNYRSEQGKWSYADVGIALQFTLSIAKTLRMNLCQNLTCVSWCLSKVALMVTKEVFGR
jgi:hypothetical protein